MRVVVDALGLPRYGGSRTSALGWLVALGDLDGDNEYHVFVSRPEEALDTYPNFRQMVAPTSNRMRVRVWAQRVLPAYTRRVRADLFHAVKNLGTFFVPVPTVMTVNDLTHLLFPDLYPAWDYVYWRFLQPLLLRRAKGIIAISNATRQALVHFYNLDPAKIEIIHPSCDSRYREPVADSLLEETRRELHLPDPYVLYVGGLAVHKNVLALVEAFESVASEIPHHLVLVGGKYHTTSDEALWNKLTDGGIPRVKLLDRVPERFMPAIYRLADLFVLPSLSEGFGLVLLEAMSSGTPVIASRAGAIPEVVGDAAYLVEEPYGSTEFAEALADVLTHPELRSRLRATGLQRSTFFSWPETGRQTLRLYERVVGAQ